MDDLSHLHFSRKFLAVVEAADEIGLLRSLADTGGTADELAARLGVHVAPLTAVLRVLAWHGIARADGDRWTVGPGYPGLLGRPDASHDLVPLLRIERWAAADHLNADGIVRALHGERHSAKIPEEQVESLAEAMRTGALAAAPHVARLPEARSLTSVADIAGGSGGYSVALCRLHRGLRATVYERPEMLPHAEKAVVEAGLGDRIDLAAWDLLGSPLPEGHDGALLSHVLHLLDRGERNDLLRRTHAALPTGGVLVVHDFLYDDPEPGSQLAGSAVDWISLGAAFVPTSEELAREAAAAGFTTDRVVRLPRLASSLLVARRV